MYAKEYDNFMGSVHHVLNLPIATRCAELTVLLDRANLFDLHNFFPILIENIFGTQGNVSWSLRTTTDICIDDYRQLHHFLSPCGPLFRLIYNLLRDPNIKFEFSLIYVPTKIKQLMEHPSGYPFYSELLNINPQTKSYSSLLLNPFDYYFFHFAYHLTNPLQQRMGSTVTSWNTVYYSLCCDYILHFLPTDPTAAILPVIYYNGKNPLKRLTPPSSVQSSPRYSSATFHTSQLREEGSLNLHNHHPRNDIWRSESVLTILTDIWLYNDSVIQTITTNDLNNSFNSTPTRLHYNELPTGEYMRIVRVLIKQLHSFADSAKCDDSYLCELKKAALPMIQTKFYTFLRNLIHRWPLDGSFRLLLELWLTYIQPWRYPASNIIKQLVKQDRNPDVDDVALGAEKQQLNPSPAHMPFIAENLLCYVVILQELLPRFGRVDLVSPKNSLMLYRITKVFDQPNLPDYLREVEESLEGTLSSNTDHQDTQYNQYGGTMNFSFLTGTGEKRWAYVARQKIFELEGHGFVYKPLFTRPPSPDTYELLVQIKRATKQAQNLITQKEHEEKELYSGFWGSVKYFLQSPGSGDEFTLDDRRKVPIYLEVAMNNLKDMFRINDEIIDDEPEASMTSNSNGFEMSSDFKFLTPERVRSRVKSIKYDGDPDLEPIRSYECAFLVRALYEMAVKTNETFGQNFYILYHDPSYWGRFARKILQPPMTVYRYDKSVMGSPRVSVHLPPRISFRRFASYRFVGYLLFGALVSWLFNYRIDTYLFIVIALYILYNLLRAIPKESSSASIRHEYPTQGFGNISFNDSF